MSWQEFQRDLKFAGGLLLRRPFHVQIQVTNRCNMKCSFCDFWPNGVPPRDELSIEDYSQLARQLSELGTFIVSIEGGEPFVRDDLVEIVRVFAEQQHLVFLYTNGWYVDEQYAQNLFAAGLTQVGISIDYPDAQRHDDKRRLQGAFEKAWRAVALFRDAAPHGGKQVHVITVLMKDNQQDIEALLKLSAAQKVGHYLTLLATKGFRRGKGLDNLPDRPISQELIELRRKHLNFLDFQDYLAQIDQFISGAEMPVCHAGEQSFNIDHLGNVSACIEKIDHVVGNVRSESIKAIYEKLQDRPEVKGCQDCWSLCRGTTQTLGRGATMKSWWEMATRLRAR